MKAQGGKMLDDPDLLFCLSPDHVEGGGAGGVLLEEGYRPGQGHYANCIFKLKNKLNTFLNVTNYYFQYI